MTETLAQALEREHERIDAGVAAYLAEGDLSALRGATVALRRHIYLEEAFLLPAVGRAGHTAEAMVVLREHGQIWRLLDQLDEAAGSGTVGDEGAVRMLCTRLTGQLRHHNLHEERDVYPLAEEVLGDPATGALREALAAATVPEGWVCYRARSRRPARQQPPAGGESART